MKLEMQMTERDKKLLIFLAIFVIVVGFGYWGIRPNIMKILDANEEMEKEEYQRTMDDMKISELTFLEKDNEDLEENIKAARENFYPMMTSSQVDKLMTGMALDYNLYAYSLNIAMPTEEAKVSAYQYSEKYQNDLLSEYEEEDDIVTHGDQFDDYDEYFADEEEEVFEEAAPTGIYAVRVTMRLGGNKETLQQLIDDLSATEQAMHLTNYEWEAERELNYDEATDEYEVTMNTALNITLNIYMCEE